MNGDGLQDIVKIRAGRLVWWPGRGDGIFGEGSRTCARGEGAGREVRVASPPREINLELQNVYLSDVNEDGAADVVQVRYDAIDVWFSRAGASFTDRVIVRGTPFAPEFLPRIRFADIDGSGTVDVIYGNAHDWQYVDLMGGVRPRLLATVDNGLGAMTTLGYEPSSIDYMEDLVDADGCTSSSCEDFAWSFVDTTNGCPPEYATSAGDENCYISGGSPVVSTVVRSVTTTDRFDEVGGIENLMQTFYAYHDGYYEGIEQEFRGFGAADAMAIGDVTEGTSTTRTYFYQGRRPGDIARDRYDESAGHVTDNPRECLKARAYLTETFDDGGTYLSSTHSAYRARKLLDGLDGRAIYYAYVSQTDELRYGQNPFVAGTSTVTGLDTVLWQSVSGSGSLVTDEADPPYDMAVRGDVYVHLLSTTESVDNVGNVLHQTDYGRVRGEEGETVGVSMDDESITTHTMPILCNAGAWAWRTRIHNITGYGSGLPQQDTTSDFDQTTCDLIDTIQLANIEIDAPDYDFGTLSQDDEEIESSTTYDDWGNALETCAGANLQTDSNTDCLRYATVGYDSAYAQLPETESIAADKSESPFHYLTTSASWDRGLGVLTDATDPNDATTEMGYDGLGRLTFVRQPTTSGCTSASRTAQVRFAYDVAPGGLPVSQITTYQHFHCTSSAGTNMLETRAYVDGLGRPRASALHSETSSKWELSGVVQFNARGAPVLAYNTTLPDVGTDPTPAQAVADLGAAVPAVITTYDAFGRASMTMDQAGFISETHYGALSTYAFDPLDEPGKQFEGTPSITRVDGHGNVIDQVLWNVQPGGGDEFYRLFTLYRADGSVVAIARVETEDENGSLWTITPLGTHFTYREFFYDTAGRRIASTDPDTNSSDAGATSADGTWRYLFNRVGDLVAVRDPRGCGQNFFYDHGGRLIGERYILCDEAQVTGDAPDVDVPSYAIGLDELGTVALADVRYYFDEEPPWISDMDGARPSTLDAGRLVAVSDRAERTVYSYDTHGNTIYTERQVALVPEEDSYTETTITDEYPEVVVGEDITPATREFDDSHTYEMTFTFDWGNRPTDAAYPADPDFTDADDIAGKLTYQNRGQVKIVQARIDGTYRYIVRNTTFHADRMPRLVYIGDASFSARLFYDYDPNTRIPARIQFIRTATSGTSLGDLGYLSEPFDQYYTWDDARNLKRFRDVPIWAEWPDSHRPTYVNITHDALYRVVDADYQYRDDTGGLVSSDTYEDWRGERTTANGDSGTHETADPMVERPAQMIPDAPANRVESMSWRYDWLANMTSWTDDASSFYERSIGDDLANGADDTVQRRPSALYLSSNLPTSEPSYDAGVDRGGWLEVEYGVSGNVVALTVHGQCHDVDMSTICWDDATLDVGDADEDRRQWLRTQCVCAAEQHYQYRWDELNRLSEARRYDRPGTGDWTLAVRQRYRYDASNQRIIKETLDDAATGAVDRYALYVYPGDYERRGLELDSMSGEYAASTNVPTESTYLIGGAKLTWTGTIGTTYAGYEIDPNVRFTYAVGDLLNTTSAVVDLWSGELLELSTYYPNGAQETSWTQHDVSLPVETAGFTGKEADDEVGIVYFGERYLIPRIARWASPDPLAFMPWAGARR